MRYYKMTDNQGVTLYVGTGEIGGEEISAEEYETLKAEILARPPEASTQDAEATAEDYQAALAEMGVNLDGD